MTGDAELQQLETALRDALTAHTRAVATGPEFVGASVDHSVAGLRRSRARRLAAGTAATAAVVALAAWQWPALTSARSDPPTSQPDQTPMYAPRMPITTADAWARSLPRGADADVAYIAGHTLVVGTKRVELADGAVGNLLGALPGGWFAELGSPAKNGAVVDPVYGYLRADGRFSAYSYQPPPGYAGGFAVSPSGARVAYADAVVDTGFAFGGGFDAAAMGRRADRLPADVASIVEWNSAALVYRDDRGQVQTWPGGGGTPLAYDEFLPGGYAFDRTADCVDVTRYALDSETHAYRICGQGDPLTVSNGKRALMQSGEIVDLETGADFLTLPVGVLPEQLQLFWQDDDSLIAVVHDNVAPTHSPVLVRCLVSAGRCERASDPLAGYPQMAAIPRSMR
jgi:hypothetical protein